MRDATNTSGGQFSRSKSIILYIRRRAQDSAPINFYT